MNDYFDARETLPAEQREARLFARLPGHLTAAARRCPGLARQLDAIDPRALTSREALAAVPVLRKSALMAAQRADPPFGGYVDSEALAGNRVFVSPGPVFVPQVSGADPFGAARALYAAGFRRGHLLHNAFSYHRSPGGFILDEGARALGCVVFPAGTGSTDTQVEALSVFAATGFTGTPDYLTTVLEHADRHHIGLPSLRLALLSGGPLFPPMRSEWTARGLRVQQCYATADLGVIAYESATDGVVHEGLLVNEDLIVEIVRPGSAEPVAAGEVGEVLVTRLQPEYPLLRFATGDLSAMLETPSPCGRTAPRLTGWMGRADQRSKIRGQFVDPEQIEAIARRHPDVGRLRLFVRREQARDVMRLELSGPPNADLAALRRTLREITGLDGEVKLAREAWPNDGRVIDDQRDLPPRGG